LGRLPKVFKFLLHIKKVLFDFCAPVRRACLPVLKPLDNIPALVFLFCRFCACGIKGRQCIAPRWCNTNAKIR
jgi:hypothetical protein